MKHAETSEHEVVNAHHFGRKWAEDKLAPMCHVSNGNSTNQVNMVSCILAQLAASGVPQTQIEGLRDHSVLLFEAAAKTFCRDVGDTLARACERDETIRPALERQQLLEQYARPAFASSLPYR